MTWRTKMKNPLDEITVPMRSKYMDDINDILTIFAAELRQSGSIDAATYIDLKTTLLNYFQQLEASGEAPIGCGFRYIQYIEPTWLQFIQ